MADGASVLAAVRSKVSAATGGGGGGPVDTESTAVVVKQPTFWEKTFNFASDSPFMSKFAAVFGEGAGGLGDRIFGETEQAEAMSELRLLMPDFAIDEFLREDISRTLAPEVLRAYLRGDVEALRRTCRDAAFGVLQRSVMEREAQQLLMDQRILHISDPELEGVRFIHGVPTPVVSFEAHQLNCVRIKQTQAIVEVSEDDIRAVHYLWALQPTEADDAEAEAGAEATAADDAEGAGAEGEQGGGAKGGAQPDEPEPPRWQVTELAVRGMQPVY